MCDGAEGVFAETFDKGRDRRSADNSVGGPAEEEVHSGEQGGVVFFDASEEFVLEVQSD